MARRPIVTLVFAFVFLGYCLIFLFAGLWPNILSIVPAILIPALICGIIYSQQVRIILPIRQHAKIAFWMAFGFAVPAALGFLLLVGIVGSTYSGETFSESLVSLLFGDIRKTGAFLIIGLAQFLGLWLASMFGLVVGQHIAQPSVKTPEGVSTGGLSPVANEEPPVPLSSNRQDDEPSNAVRRAPGTVRLITLLTLISLALLFLFAYAAGRPIGFSGPVELIFPLFVATALGAWWATAIRSQPDRQQRARVAIWSTILGWLVIAAYWVFLVITVIGLSNLNEMQGLELDVTAVSLMIMTTTTLITLAITYAILEFGLWLGAWLARRR